VREWRHQLVGADDRRQPDITRALLQADRAASRDTDTPARHEESHRTYAHARYALPVSTGREHGCPTRRGVESGVFIERETPTPGA